MKNYVLLLTNKQDVFENNMFPPCIIWGQRVGGKVTKCFLKAGDEINIPEPYQSFIGP